MALRYGRSPVAGVKCQSFGTDVDGNFLVGAYLAVQQHPGQLIVYLALDGAAHRTGAEFWLVAMLSQPVDGRLGESQRDVLRVQPAPGLIKQEPGDLAQFGLV